MPTLPAPTIETLDLDARVVDMDSIVVAPRSIRTPTVQPLAFAS